jgi:hypothetical protein
MVKIYKNYFKRDIATYFKIIDEMGSLALKFNSPLKHFPP